MNAPSTFAWLLKKEKLAVLLCGLLLTLAIGLWIGEQAFAAMDRLATGQSPTAEASRGLLLGVPAQHIWRAIAVFCWVGIGQTFCLILYEIHAQRKQAPHAAEQPVHARWHSDLVRTRDAVIFGLAKLAESRDNETGHHLERIAAYSTRLAQAMRRTPEFRDQVSGQFVQDIGVCSALHDIGKVAVEDAVLLKPAPLTADERQRMQVHPEVGARCIEQIERRLGEANFLGMAREIALSHHERWNGGGYPVGLSGRQIPLAARVVAIADVYDALSSQRIYKVAIPHEECVRIIAQQAELQFDPQIVDVFLKIDHEFYRIRQRFTEPDGEANSVRQSRELSDRLMSPDDEQQLWETIEPSRTTSEAKVSTG